MSEVKFCKDCVYSKYVEKYYIDRKSLFFTGLTCIHYKCLNVVDGETDYSCDDNRKENKCGPEAKYFEPRLSLWQRVKQWVKF